MKILHFPLTRVFIGFLFGILLFRIVSFNTALLFSTVAFCIIGLQVSSFYIQKERFFRIIFGSFTFITSILIGLSTAQIHKENATIYHYTNQITDFEKVHTLDVLLIEKLKSTQKNNRYVSAVKKLNNQRSLGKVILNISKSDTKSNLKIGSRLQVVGIVFKNKIPLNPSMFDYGKYLENKEIYAQVFVKSKQILVGNQYSNLWSTFSNFRETILSNLEKSAIT